MSKQIYENKINLQLALKNLQDKVIGGANTSDATATAETILEGKTAYVQSGKITGSMPNNGAVNLTMDGIDTKSITIAAGYTSGGTVSLDDTIDNEVDEQSELIEQITAALVGKAHTNANHDMEDGFVEGTATEYVNPRVSKIGSRVFYYNQNLTSVNFPACITIGPLAFYTCYKLTAVDFPVCTSIGASAFAQCGSLTNVSFPACTTIGSSAFVYCSNLTNVSFPACKSINQYAFYSCPNLTTASFPACTSVRDYAFNRCSKLTSIDLPVCKEIGSFAFNYCSSLASINFPACLNVYNSAFQSCVGLTTVNLPACSRIEYVAFANCTNLTSVNLGNCSYIGTYTFNQCKNLTTLVLKSSGMAQLGGATAFSGTPMAASANGVWGSIYVPASLVSSYKANTNWAAFAERIVSLESLENTD